MLEARDLTLWRGDICLFERLSLRVAPGGGLILRGANGAGKTTLLRVLCGLTLPEEGVVRWQGRAGPAHLRGRFAYGGHAPALNGDLTVSQNLDFYSRLPGAAVGWRDLVTLLGLDRCRDLEVRYLSAGQKRRAGLARVLMSGAPVWLLDEPFTNLDADGRRLVEERVGRHLAAGGLAVVAAHDEIRLPVADVATITLGNP